MDRNLEMVNVDPLDISTTCRSKDQGLDATSFGHNLLELGSPHRMIIYNGLAKCQVARLGRAHMFPTWNDYLIGRSEAIHMINSFCVVPCTIDADHSFKCDISNVTNSSQPSHHITIHFTHAHSRIYCRHVQAHLSSLDSSLPSESLTTELIHIL